jgi:alpha-tubulin suppressor-like RCC1 family protein
MSVHKALLAIQSTSNIGPLFQWGLNTSGQLGDSTTTLRSSPVQVGTSYWSQVATGDSGTVAVRADGGLYAWGLLPFGVSSSSPVVLASGKWSKVAMGNNHALAIKSDGSLWSVGLGSSGQLGDTNTSFNQSWTQVAHGTSHALAIRNDGALFVWGSDTDGALGVNSTTASYSSPVQLGTASWIYVSAENNFGRSMAIRSDGALFGWGYNLNGELGDNTIISRSSPVQIGTSSWTAVSSGRPISAALRIDGAMFTWGSGPIGDNTIISRSSPVQIGTSSWSMVSAGFSTFAAIRIDGALFTWGYNRYGQMGNNVGGTLIDTSSPVQIGTSSWTKVSSGSTYTAAIRNDGALFTWGNNANGCLGEFTTTAVAGNRSSPVQIGTSSWTQVRAGVNIQSTFAIRNDGGLFGWGINTVGLLGLNDTISRSSPVQIGTSSWTQICSLAYRTMQGILTNGVMYGWGAASVGDGTASGFSSPVQVAALPGRVSLTQIGSSSWSQISAGGNVSAGITTANTLFVWGDNSVNQLGDYTTANKTYPIPVAPLSWSSVAKGASHSAAVRSDGALFTWGTATTGCLGDNANVSRSSPVQIGNSSWSTVSCGICHTMAIRSDSTAWGWGAGTNGCIGDGTTTNRSSPVQIGTGLWNKLIAFAASTSSMGIRSDGTLYTWGLNTSAQLGLNDIVNRSSPSQVGTSSWTQIAGWTLSSAAIRTDGGLFTWGVGSAGQLGLNDALPRSSPTQVGTSSWTQVSMASNTMQAIRTDGGLFTTGAGTGGLGGTNNTTQYSSPVQIGTSSWTLVKITGNNSYAIRSDGTLWAWGVSTILGNNTASNASSPVQIGSASWTQLSANSGGVIGVYNNVVYLWGSTNESGNGLTDTVVTPYPSITINTGLNNSFPSSWTNVAVGPSHIVAIDKTSYNVYGFGYNNSSQLAQTTDSTQSWSQIALGGATAGEFALALRSDGILFAWGYNAQGQLGDNTITTRSSPVQVGGFSWTKISAGVSSSAAIRSDNKLFTWGGNSFGQLGQNDTTARSAPTQVGNSSWIQISTGGGINTLSDPAFTGALRSDNGLFMWGGNTYGVLGLNDVVARSSPVQVGSSSWTAISAGEQFAAGIKTDGSLWSWGYGNITNNTYSSPVQVGTSSWSQISAGYDHALGIDINGRLYSGGFNQNGQLGSNNTTQRNNMSSTVNNTVSWAQVSAGPLISFAKTTTGQLWAWGTNANGQLGLNDLNNRSSPVQVGTSSWAQLASSAGTMGNFFAGILNNNALYIWGVNTVGELGDNTTTSRSSPAQVGTQAGTQTIQLNRPTVITGSSWTQVAAGPSHTMAIKNDNTLWGWGSYASSDTTNSYFWWTSVKTNNSNALAIRSDGALFALGGAGSLGQTGLNTGNPNSSPVQIGTSSWTQISVGVGHALAIRKDGALFAWGDNSNGQLGDNTAGSLARKSSPIQIGTSSWSQVAAGSSYSFAIRSDGALFSWGNNAHGALGDSTTAVAGNRSSPVQIGTSSWSLIATNTTAFNAAAIRTDGGLFTWGWNFAGQLALNDRTDRSSPVQIGTSSWSQISVGISSMSGIKLDQTLWSWGGNANGELGLNDIINRSSPVQIGTSSWSQISANNVFMAAIRTDGALYTWGSNANGQLGDTVTAVAGFRSSPVQIGTSSFTQISNGAGAVNLFAIRINGALFGTGQNSFGELGLNDLNARSSPVQVGSYPTAPFTSTVTQMGALSYKQVAAGLNNTYAISNTNKLYSWGSNTSGMIGNSPIPFVGLTVSPVQIGTSNWITVSAGQSHVGAVRYP